MRSACSAVPANEQCVILLHLQAHIFDRAAEETMLYLGAKIGFWRGDIKVRPEAMLLPLPAKLAHTAKQATVQCLVKHLMQQTDIPLCGSLHHVTVAHLLHGQGLVDDIGALRPTIFIGVPRVFDRIYSGVLAKIQVKLVGRREVAWSLVHHQHRLDH
jgi:hypothetical protein